MIIRSNGIDEIDTDLRAIIPFQSGGNLIMSGLPGLVIARDGTSFLDPERCTHTFEKLAEHKTKAIYLLMEEMELPPQAKSNIQKAAETSNMDIYWLPIVDFNTPDETFTKIWRQSVAYRSGIIEQGDSICLCCMYGAGRSGMMATSIIVQDGKDSSDAIKYIRSIYPEAIGSEKQEKWLKSHCYLS